MDADIRDDYLTWDHTESVTLQSVRNSGDMIDTVVEWVKRRKVTARDLATSGGALQGSDVRFLFPGALVLNGPPKPGDWVVDLKDNRFRVLTVDGQKYDSVGSAGNIGYATYVCGCRNLALHHDLSQTDVVIEEPAVNLDSKAVSLRTWVARFSGFRCKVQKLLDETAEERAIRGFKGQFAVYLETELAITADMRVRWSGAPAGYLEVLKYHPAAALDQLPMIDCEAVP